MNLQKHFPGVIAITPQEAGHAVLGQSRQTTNNQLCAGRFPLPVTLLGDGKRMVLLEDLQTHIDTARQQSTKTKRKVGRPSKASQMLASMGGDHE